VWMQSALNLQDENVYTCTRTENVVAGKFMRVLLFQLSIRVWYHSSDGSLYIRGQRAVSVLNNEFGATGQRMETHLDTLRN
jgi:hypothetical protein